MNPKIITSLMLILIIANISATTFYTTPVLASNTRSAANDLQKSADFKKSAPTTIDSLTNDTTNLGADQANQINNSASLWGSNSTEIVIGLSDTWGAYEKIQQLAAGKDGKIVNKVMMGGKIEAVVVNVPQNFHDAFTTEIRENGLSRYMEPNLKYDAFMVPNDPYWYQQWGPRKIEADYAWNTTTGSKSVLVAVVDTGIDYKHPDLAANYVPLGYDWVNNDTDPMDDMGHGTHCAGIIAAVINNNQGIAGLAQIKIMAEKGLDATGSGNEVDLANAIIHATDQKARIISMSWGGSSSSVLIYDAIKYAYSHGVLLVAAAGNSASSLKNYPAAYDEVIAVTATDPVDLPAYFTSYGDWVELAAPGFEIYSTISSVHDPRFNYPYDFLSGTSMACPHVVGVAALVWSQFPNMARDVLRLHLRDTADDLGDPGFDVYYGYGRINARKAIEQPLPEHDLIITGWKRPPYIEPSGTGRVNATICNYGRNNETNVSVQLLLNGTLEQSINIPDFLSGTSTDISFSWTPTIKGNYNVTIFVVPVSGETKTEDNIVQGYVYVDYPLKVFVLRSAGNEYVDAWDFLNYNWRKFGNRLINIDYETLNKDNITYSDLSATGADVLILSCAYAWEYTDEEINAIQQYVYEGHGFIATAGTFYYRVPNNSKFGPLFGLNESILWTATTTDFLDLLNPSHPVFAKIPNPYTFTPVGTATPFDGVWSSNELVNGTYIAMGYFNESAVVVHNGLIYISPWFEVLPDYYYYSMQIIYNAITWSKYRIPESNPPIVKIISPKNNSYVKGVVNITVSGSDENLDHFDLYIDTGLIASYNKSGVYTYLWATSEPFAIHQITLKAYDVFQNTANTTITVTVDNELPYVHIDSPANNAYVHGSITITFGYDDLFFKNASITIGSLAPRNVTGTSTLLFDTRDLYSDGSYPVKLTAFDLAGNKAETSITINVDNTPPDAQITSPANNSYVKNTINIMFIRNDTNLENATLAIDGQVFIVTATTYYTWNMASVSDGEYTIVLTVSDKAGNTKTDQITVTVDKTAPTGGITAPSNGAYLRGMVNVTFYGYDPNIDFIKLDIVGGIGFIAWNVSGTYSRAWNTSESEDGLYVIVLDVYDKAGNVFLATVTVTVDNTPPDVTVTNPQVSINAPQNVTLSGVVTIRFNVTDNISPYNVSLIIDDSQVSLLLGQTSYRWDTTKVADGNHTIRIIATDYAGNVREVTVKVKTSNAIPAYIAYLGYVGMAVLGLALGVLSTWLFMRRKSKTTKQAFTATTASTTTTV